MERVSWRGVFENTRWLKGLLVKVPLIISGSLSVEIGLALAHFTKQVRRLRKGSGLLFTALYLKQCGVALQRFYAGSPIQHESMPVAVSLTRSGLPRIIPKRHRQAIARRDDRADKLVRLYLSWFGLSRIVVLAKRISKSTFQSITTPTADVGRLKGVLGLVKVNFSRLQKRYFPYK